MIAFRQANLDELELVLGWAAAEGWNPGRDDARAFLSADPEGFFLATDGELPVGSISVVNHNEAFAFLGLYIMRPEYRGRGIGYRLWQHALKHAGGRVVGLDGVPEQQANYEKSHFVHASGTTRFSGAPAPKDVGDLRPATPRDVPELIEMEAFASGYRKANYLETWFAGASSRVTYLREIDGRISGAATVRGCVDGAKVGPLLASDAQTADDLLCHAAKIFGPKVTVDVPAGSNGLAELCLRRGLVPGFNTARMYKGPAPNTRSEFYAVASLELG